MIARVILVAAALAVGLASGGALALVAHDSPPRPRVPRAPPRTDVVAPTVAEEVDTVLAWTPGGLPPGFDEKVRKLGTVRDVTAVVSGTAWLTASFSGSGVIVDRPPRGLAIPLDVAGAHLSSFSTFVAPTHRRVLADLARGQGVLSATSARLRRVREGGTLEFGKHRIRVAAIVPDAPIGAHELLVSRATARQLGLVRERYLLIDPARWASRERLGSALRQLLPPTVPIQVRGPGETPYFRQGDAVLPPVRLKELFGEFAARPRVDGSLEVDPAWTAQHITRAHIPLLGSVSCNRALLPQLRGALGEIAARGLGHLVDPRGFAGCYGPRFVNRSPDPHGSISHHAWGVAVDVNVHANPFGAPPQQDKRLVEIMKRWGFTWGGEWVVPDGMHFEFVRFAPGS